MKHILNLSTFLLAPGVSRCFLKAPSGPPGLDWMGCAAPSPRKPLLLIVNWDGLVGGKGAHICI